MLKAFKLIFELIALYLKAKFIGKEKRVFITFQSPWYGGGKTFFLYITRYFQERGLEIYLLAQEKDAAADFLSYCKDRNINVIIFKDEIKPIACYCGNKWNKAFLFFLYNYLQQLRFLLKIFIRVRPRFVFASVGWPFMWFPVLYLPGKVYSVYHVMPLHYNDYGTDFMLKLALRFGNNIFLSVSDFAGHKMREYWIDDYKKLITIYNYFEPKAKFETGNWKLGKKSKIYNPKSTIVTVLALARVEDGKNPLLWLEIAKEIIKIRPNVRFVWAGDGSLLEEAKKLVQDESRIQFIGYKNNVDELYAQADLYFEPSKRESHGISVVGAMAYGLPSIATNFGGTTESVIDGYNGYIVDVTNKAQMTDRLLKLIDDKTLREAMGEKGRQRWSEMFTREIWEGKMDKLLNYK